MSDLATADQGVQGGGTPPSWLLAVVSELYILTKERTLVRFGDVLNYAQVDFIHECERQLAVSGQIRLCVLKARQIGISTVIEAIAFVLSIMFDDMHTLIISHEKKSSEAILDMTKRYWSTYIFKEMHTERYNGKNQLSWFDTGSNIEVVTAKNVDAGRSMTIHILHASEVAFWPEPEVLMTGLAQSIPTFGLTAIFLESTANGLGNYFHKMCTEAMRGDNDYGFKFYPWHQHPEYTATHIPTDKREKYAVVDKLDDEEQWLATTYKLPIERLVWRRWAIANKCQGSLDKFHQEYPSTPHEAFVSTGRNVFSLPAMLRHYQPRKGRRGVLQRRGNKVEFVPHEDGWLTLFSYPSPDKNWGVYVAGGDPTHTTTGDNAVIQVLNRRTLEQVAVYRNKIDPINFGKHMQLVGAYFHNALLAPEKEGPGYATVGCIVGDNYPNVYQAQNVAKAPGHPADVFGWSTNMATKHLAISHLVKAFSDTVTTAGDATYGLMLHDEVTLMELRDYVTTEDGRGYENGDGSMYDDGVMALAIALTVHNIEPPVPAYQPLADHELPPNVARVPVSGTGASMRSGAVPRPVAVSDLSAPDDPGDSLPPWEAWGASRD